MALYDRDYASAEAGYVQEGASVSFMKKTYQLLAASMIAAAAGAYVTMPYAEAVMQYKWFIFGAELLVLFFGLSMTRSKPGLNLAMLFIFNYFLLQSPMMHIIITAGILLLFSIFTIYDTQNIANGAYDSPVDAAVSLYIDFLNMFTALLQLLIAFH